MIADLARPVRHTYHTSGRAFYLVPCDRCSIVLNSGHHYAEEAGAPSRFAVELAEAHNLDAHEAEPCQDCRAPIEWDEDRQTYRHHGPACYLSSTSGWIVP